MRTAAQINNAGAVDHLVEDEDVSRRLDQLDVVVVRARHHRRPGVESEDAALGERTLFGIVEMVPAFLDPLLRRGRQRRDAAVGRIDHQRGLRGDPGPEVPPEIVVGAFHVHRRTAVAAILVRRFDAVLGELLRLFFRNRLLSGEFAGTLERSELGEIPRALQVGPAIGCAGQG